MEKEVRTNYIAPATEEQMLIIEGIIANSGRTSDYEDGGVIQ